MGERAAIKVSGLGKQYVLGGAEKGDVSFREMLTDSLMSPLRRLRRLRGERSEEETFWALRDIEFEVRPGEVVGIIGRNGAGKSTLLKILSRITDPTEGRVEIRGRVSSLLEVGTGFHPELTGRENIFLNGAVLGMSRREILAKFDEIVAFAEVEKFLDTPVKRYSSGMYVRLAFAVAAHLEPEILVVDEVLAVGDAAFQKKCLGKMSDVSKEGRTVLFVSHNMSAIRSLCSRAILLNDGKVLLDSNVDEVLERYLEKHSENILGYECAEESDTPHFRKVALVETERVAIDKPFHLHIEVDPKGRSNLVISLVIRNMQDVWAIHSSDEFGAFGKTMDSAGKYARNCEIPAYALAPGKYFVDVYLEERACETIQVMSGVLVFEVEFEGVMSNLTKADDWRGICGPGLVKWGA